MTQILDYLQKNFTGVRSLNWGPIKAVPKVARLFLISVFTMLIGETILYNDVVLWIGRGIGLLAIFCFFMLRIFKKRQFNGLTETKYHEDRHE